MHFILKTFVLSVVLCACTNSKKVVDGSEPGKTSSVSTMNEFDKEGHRGCRGLMPENTIPALIHALGLGVNTLEIDVVITKDRQVILSHEPFFNHEISTKPDGSFIEEKDEKNYNIFEMMYEDVKKFDVGMKPHPRFPQQEKIKAIKPLLSDVFKAAKEDMMTRRRPFPYFNIETKTTSATDNKFHPAPGEFVELLMQVIKDNQMEDHVIIQSFDIRTLKYLHEKYPHIITALLIEENEGNGISDKIKAMGFMPDILSPHYSLITKELLDEWHSNNRKVIPWTVNDIPTMEKLKTMKVDGIITDYPNLFNE